MCLPCEKRCYAPSIGDGRITCQPCWRFGLTALWAIQCRIPETIAHAPRLKNIRSAIPLSYSPQLCAKRRLPTTQCSNNLIRKYGKKWDTLFVSLTRVQNLLLKTFTQTSTQIPLFPVEANKSRWRRSQYAKLLTRRCGKNWPAMKRSSRWEKKWPPIREP